MTTSEIPQSDKIRLARHARKMTLQDVGKKAEIHYSLLSLFENGRLMTPEQYDKIQAALGFDLESEAASAAFSFFYDGAPHA